MFKIGNVQVGAEPKAQWKPVVKNLKTDIKTCSKNPEANFTGGHSICKLFNASPNNKIGNNILRRHKGKY